MKTKNKFFLTLFLVGIFCLGISNFSLAQSSVEEKKIVQKSINLEIGDIDITGGNTVSVGGDVLGNVLVKNNSNFNIGETYLEVSLHRQRIPENSESSPFYLNKQTIITFNRVSVSEGMNPGQGIIKNFSIKIPKGLEGGNDYYINIQAFNAKEDFLADNYERISVKDSNSKSAFLEFVEKDSFLLGRKTLHRLQNGAPFVYDEEYVVAKPEFEFPSQLNINLEEIMKNEVKAVIPYQVTSGSFENPTIKMISYRYGVPLKEAGSKTFQLNQEFSENQTGALVLKFPLYKNPGTYETFIQLFNGKDEISNKIGVRYTTEGDSGMIRNINFEKKNETNYLVSVEIIGPADAAFRDFEAENQEKISGNLRVLAKESEGGKICLEKSVDVDIAKGGWNEILMNIPNCKNPVFEAELVRGSEILDKDSVGAFDLSKQSELKKENKGGMGKIVVISLFAVALVVAIIFIIRKRKMNRISPIVFVFALLSLGAGVFWNFVQAATPTIYFKSSKSFVHMGESFTLSWSASNAVSCTASGGWSGSKGVGTTGWESIGSYKYSEEISGIDSNTVFTLTCIGSAGEVSSRDVSVQINSPTVSIDVAPDQVLGGGSSVISWTTRSATSCNASGGWSGAKAVSGKETVSGINPPTTFTLSCSGPGGSAQASTSVTLGSFALESPSNGTNLSGTSANFRWERPVGFIPQGNRGYQLVIVNKQTKEIVFNSLNSSSSNNSLGSYYGGIPAVITSESYNLNLDLLPGNEATYSWHVIAGELSSSCYYNCSLINVYGNSEKFLFQMPANFKGAYTSGLGFLGTNVTIGYSSGYKWQEYDFNINKTTSDSGGTTVTDQDTASFGFRGSNTLGLINWTPFHYRWYQGFDNNIGKFRLPAGTRNISLDNIHYLLWNCGNGEGIGPGWGVAFFLVDENNGEVVKHYQNTGRWYGTGGEFSTGTFRYNLSLPDNLVEGRNYRLVVQDYGSYAMGVNFIPSFSKFSFINIPFVIGNSNPVLTVAKIGAGNGAIASTPSGISCGSDCQEPYAVGTNVTLTASVISPNTFDGWLGCDSTNGENCYVTMTNENKTVQANFGGSISAGCGNGILESGEACDDGSNNGNCPLSCSSSCETNNCQNDNNWREIKP